MIKKISLVAVLMSVLFMPAFSKEELIFNSSRIKIEEKEWSWENSVTDEEETYDSFFGLLIDMLIAENFLVFYGKYPFYNNEPFINFCSDDEPSSGKFWRMEVETGAFSFPAKKFIGSETRIEGVLYHIIGPVIEYQHIAKTNKDDIMGNLKLGGQFFIFQSNFICASIMFQWNKVFIIEPEHDRASGPGLGIILKSYIIPKCILEWRASVAVVSGYTDESCAISESHLELGYMVAGPHEIYAAWKRQENEILDYNTNGFALGLKFHF